MVLQSYYPISEDKMSRNRMVINMSVSPELYSMINNAAEESEISRSELLRRSLKQYIASERRWQTLRAWGKETAKRMRIKDERDVEKIIDEYRGEQKR